MTIIANVGSGRQMNSIKLFDAETITASGSKTSEAVKVDRADGVFSFYESITGDGTIKIEYLVSVDGTNFVTPSTASEIATSQTKASGTSGKDVIAFASGHPILAPYIKIKVTETGGVNSVTLTGYLTVQ